MIKKAEGTVSIINNFDAYSRSISTEAPGWLNDLRQEGLMQFAVLGLPTKKNEEWKYTNIAPITKSKFSIATNSSFQEKDALNEYSKSDEVRIVFVNGFFSTELSHLEKVPKEIKITTILEAVNHNGSAIKDLFHKYDTKDEATFVALNKALTYDGVFISVEAKTVIDPLIHIIHITSACDTQIISTPRSFITLDKSSEATILESHLSFSNGNPYLANALTDIFLEENATVHYCKSQRESDKAFHVGATRVWQERNSNFDGFSFMNGSAITRNNLDIVFNGEGANANLNGLYGTNGRQLVDNHTCVDHRLPNCTSNQLYKGILNGASHAVFNGKVFVRSIAQQTNSYQLNKNLLLGKDCRVDTKPQLEIFADDVKCTHGATIGQLNEDEIFYLQSRCIEKRDAIKMLSRGFMDDLLDTIASQDIHHKLTILLEPTIASL